MKFGKLIQALIEEAQPAWKDKFLPYKSLKKRLHSLLAAYIELSDERDVPAPAGCESPEHTRQHDAQADQDERSEIKVRSTLNECSRKRGGAPEGRDAKRRRHYFDAELKRLLELEFKCLLQEELNKLNDFVLDMEEEFIIKMQDFKEKTESLKEIIEANDENHSCILNLQKDVVVFHGEMILLKNYMSLNYTGLVKIVKKHDRLTGAWLRMSFIPAVLRQPFYNTEILSRLVTDCESDLLSLFPSCSGETADCPPAKETQLDSAFLDDGVFNEEILRRICKSTMTALKVIRNMARGSSTYSVYSMPPCDDNEDAGSEI